VWACFKARAREHTYTHVPTYTHTLTQHTICIGPSRLNLFDCSENKAENVKHGKMYTSAYKTDEDASHVSQLLKFVAHLLTLLLKYVAHFITIIQLFYWFVLAMALLGSFLQ